MKRCPASDCGSPVPMAAKFCPRCGCRLRHPGASVVIALLVGLAMVFVFVLAARDTGGVLPADPQDALRATPDPHFIPAPVLPRFPTHR